MVAMRTVVNLPLSSVGIVEAGSPVAVPLRAAPDGLLMLLML